MDKDIKRVYIYLLNKYATSDINNRVHISVWWCEKGNFKALKVLNASDIFIHKYSARNNTLIHSSYKI